MKKVIPIGTIILIAGIAISGRLPVAQPDPRDQMKGGIIRAKYE